MNLKWDVSWKPNRFLVAVMAVAVASVLRIWPLGVLGPLLAWLTFYPAVMVAAICGGFFAGLLGTSLACLVVIFLGPLLVGEQFIRVPAEWVGMGVFILNGTIISGIAESALRANSRAQKAQAEAEAASKAKSVFLASMSHELRTPLNAILGFSGLLRNEDGISPEQRQTLDLINRSGEHLLNLINDVLDMAKIEAGQLSVVCAPFDLGEMVRDLIDLMHMRAEEKGLQVTLNQTSKFPRMVRGDGVKLRQSLLNLMGNAIKFTAQGSVTLCLNARPGDTPNELWLVCEVWDTGIGISAENQESIFKPFVQISQSGQQILQKGTGLGLTITRQYVKLMGGSISVTSTQDQGSCFRLEVPVERVDEAEIVAYSAHLIDHGRIIGMEPGQPEYRILIVEDQIENWLLLRRLLEGVGLLVRVAENGQLGVEMFQSWRPHLIWMDIRMPVLDGLEATRRIRTLEGGQSVKIVALTASVFKEERDRVMAVGMDDFIAKPFRPDEIFDSLTRNLGVRFVREDVGPKDVVVQAAALRPEALATLPVSLRKELGDALTSLDNERIMEVLRHVTELDPAQGFALTHLAEQLAYTTIYRAIKASMNTDEEIDLS